MAITYQNKDLEKTARKHKKGPVIGCVAAASAVVGLVALGIWTYVNDGLKSKAYDSPTEVAQAFAEKFYSGDAAGVFSMQPEVMQARSKQDTEEVNGLVVDGSVESVVDIQRGTMDVYLDSVAASHGDNWKADFSVGEYTGFSDEEVEKLSLSYRMMGVADDFELDDAGYVLVTATLSGDSGSEPADVKHYVPVIKYKGGWYIGQEFGDEYMAAVDGIESMTGDLLDGYHTVGEFDINGERIYRTEDGMQIMQDEKGEYFYEDFYGNKHYCEFDVLDIYGLVSITKDEKVVGPHGGEALTEETYEAYWDAYYEKLADETNYSEDVHAEMSGTISDNSLSE